MKLVMLSLRVSLLAYSPVFSIPRDRTTFNNINFFIQAKPVTGTVTDNNGQPLVRSSSLPQKVRKGTRMTNDAGSFSIEVPAGC